MKQRTPCTNINKEAAQIQKSIVSAAHHSISQTKPISRKYKVPWWNKDLQTLRTNKQKAWYDYKSRRTDVLLIVYKKAKATFKLHSKGAKRSSLELFTSEIILSLLQRNYGQISKRFLGLINHSRYNS